MNNKNQAFYRDPKLVYPGLNTAIPFHQYIEACRSLIANSRLDLLSSKNDDIIFANSPFELNPVKPNRQGVLLIHGLYDSPFMLRDIGEAMHAKGFLVRSILLPGHGTLPGALLNVTYTDWLTTVNFGIESFKGLVDSLFLTGFSTGALLAMHHVLSHNNDIVKGIISFSPALQINSAFTFMSHWHKLLSGKFKKLAWLNQFPENDYAKYQSCTFNSIYQVYKLGQQVQSISKPMSCPQLVLLPFNDRTVVSDAAIKHFLAFASAHSQLIIYANSQLSYADTRIIIKNSRYPDLNIEDFSHVSLPISPMNSHYGKYGDYVLASHVEESRQQNKNIIYGAANTADEIISNLWFKLGIQKKLHLRLTFNPDFEWMCDAILKFMHHVLN